jgi:hypothetical protein
MGPVGSAARGSARQPAPPPPPVAARVSDIVKDGRGRVRVRANIEVGLSSPVRPWSRPSAAGHTLTRGTHNGSFQPVCTQERILKTFRITGLIKIFSIHPSVEDATNKRE